MPGTIKLIGNEDERWDDTLENADHSVDTRLIGKEDIYWDSEGKGEQGSFIDRTGTDRPITMLNASHIPLPTAVREVCDGAENVAEGMLKLSQMSGRGGSGGGSGSMGEDTVITIAENLLQEERQGVIDSQARDLGGHTLTISFPEAIDLFFSDPLNFSGFYNGELVIDLNGITISDNIDMTKLFYISDCQCKVEVKNGTMHHTLSKYAIYAERSPYIYLTDMIFTGSGGTTNAAFFGIDSDGYASGCVYDNDDPVKMSGLGSDHASNKASTAAGSAVSTHNASETAHLSLFAGKANVNHTHTPGEAGADAAGTAATAVNAHNTADDAHSGILAPLASPAFTGSPTVPTPPVGDNSTRVATTAYVAAAIDATPGIIDRDVSNHNTSATAHSGILAPLASPAFTGSPTVPTAVAGTSSDQAASTKFVQNAIEYSDIIPETIDEKVTIHNTTGDAHKALFDSKANLRHTHTPEEIGADAAGRASQVFSEHDTSGTAHASLFARKANVDHTHTPGTIGADVAGTATASVNAHNTASNAHESLFASLIPAGTVFPFAGNSGVPSGYRIVNGTVKYHFLLCNGQAVSRYTYSELFNAIGTLYGSGNGSGTFNLPDFRGAFLRGYESGVSSAIGTKQNEGLPDITGTLPGNKIDTTATYTEWWDNVTGAFSKPGTAGNNKRGDYSADTGNNNIEFKASNSNSIYGASKHVTPVNYAVQYIIKT